MVKINWTCTKVFPQVKNSVFGHDDPLDFGTVGPVNSTARASSEHVDVKDVHMQSKGN